MSSEIKEKNIEEKSKKFFAGTVLLVAVMILVFLWQVFFSSPNSSIGDENDSTDPAVLIEKIVRNESRKAKISFDTEIGTTTISVDLAVGREEREKGLSGKESLPKNFGMLFVFDSDDYWTIWMSGMKFPIDVIWLNKNLEVVSIFSHMTPETYPRAFAPQGLSRYVLEVSDGFASQSKISVGDKFFISE